MFKTSFLPNYRVRYYDYIVLAGYPASLGRKGGRRRKGEGGREGGREGGERGRGGKEGWEGREEEWEGGEGEREGPDALNEARVPSSPPSLPLILFKTV